MHKRESRKSKLSEREVGRKKLERIGANDGFSLVSDTSEVGFDFSTSFGPTFKKKKDKKHVTHVHVFPVYRSFDSFETSWASTVVTYQSYQSQFAIWNRACWTHSRGCSFSWPVISPLSILNLDVPICWSFKSPKYSLQVHWIFIGGWNRVIHRCTHLLL